MSDRSAPRLDMSAEFHKFFKARKDANTDMGLEEAVEIVLALARGLEWDENFDWELEHSEACGVVDRTFFGE